MEDNLVGLTTAHVLSTLLGVRKRPLTQDDMKIIIAQVNDQNLVFTQESKKQKKFIEIIKNQLLIFFKSNVSVVLKQSEKCCILLLEEELNKLVTMRLVGFRGSVIVLSSKSIDNLCSHHKILEHGTESCQSLDCQNKNSLIELIKNFRELQPLGLDKIKKLQGLLSIPDSYLKKKVLSYLVKINQSEESFNSNYHKLKNNLDRVFQITKSLCDHGDIENSKKSISESWKEVKNEIDDQYQNFKQEHINIIQDIVESYHSRLIHSEEGLILTEEIFIHEQQQF